MENGYPKHFIRRLSNRHHNPLDSQPEPTAVAVLPYIQGLSDSIKRILQKDVGIKPIRPAGSLKHTLSRSKDPLPVLLRSGVVYRIPCKDCNTSYVGTDSQDTGSQDQRTPTIGRHWRHGLQCSG